MSVEKLIDPTKKYHAIRVNPTQYVIKNTLLNVGTGVGAGLTAGLVTGNLQEGIKNKNFKQYSLPIAVGASFGGLRGIIDSIQNIKIYKAALRDALAEHDLLNQNVKTAAVLIVKASSQ